MHGKPLETSPQLIGDNHSKLLALIMEPNPKGIKTQENQIHDLSHFGGRDLTSGSWLLELTLKD
jgi:hypothetical protein